MLELIMHRIIVFYLLDNCKFPASNEIWMLYTLWAVWPIISTIISVRREYNQMMKLQKIMNEMKNQ